MAHNINITNGVASMMYTGQRPWHGLGTELDNPATSVEAIAAAHLDWEVKQEPIYQEGNKKIPNLLANVRQDTKDFLGLATPRYKILQNGPAFDFMDTLVGEKAAMYHTAGALGKGEKIWLLAKLPKDLLVAPDDAVEKFLVLVNSHDGKSCLRVYFTPIRVVCQNTLSQSLAQKSREVVISHRGDIQSKINEARKVLGLALEYFDEFDIEAKALVNYKLTVASAEKYFNRCLGFDEKTLETEKMSTRARNTRDAMLQLFEKGKGNDNPAVRHSLWAGYNAVTEYVDHFKTIRGTQQDASNRLKDLWFGTGAQLKDRAFQEALVLVK